jgi:PAB1-binding protein PBP1
MYNIWLENVQNTGYKEYITTSDFAITEAQTRLHQRNARQLSPPGQCCAVTCVSE